jgi:Tfp pilus assembly protein PilO
MDRANWIAVGLVFAAATVYMLLFFLPRMRAIARSLDELDSRLAYVLEAQKSARATDLMQHQLDDVLGYIEQHDEQLMSQDDLPILFRRISDISKANNAITTRFEPHPDVPYHSFKKASVNLGVHGPFAAVHGVVRDLEALPMRIWVDDLKIRKSGETGENVECDMHLVVFVDNPEKSD